jgi:hypothetical protein
MTTEKKDTLLDAPSVESWIEDHEPGGIEKLHSAVSYGRVKGVRARAFVTKYLWSRDETPMSAEEARAVVRDQRSTSLVKRAVKWAVAATLFALATLFISTWSLINDWIMR